MSGDSQDASEPLRILDVEGHVVDGAEPPDLGDEELLEMYRELRFARHFDERTVRLQRQGRVGTYPPMAGHEGAQVGSTRALAPEDPILYQYREHAVAFARGVDPANVLGYWQGKPAAHARLADANVFPVNIPIGSQIPHAVGAAMASRRGGEPIPAVACHFGEGATSEGDFHEGLNFAGVFDTPNVFVCNNNQYAISVPRNRQTAAETIATKASAYGFEGVRVDGMDPLAMYEACRAARERATGSDPDGPRPTLIEAELYRFGAHTTADDPSRYRDEAEVERWRRRDPITRFERFLVETGRLDEETVEAVGAEAEARMEAAVEAAESGPVPDAADVFEHVYATLPSALREQRDALLGHLESRADRRGSE